MIQRRRDYPNGAPDFEPASVSRRLAHTVNRTKGLPAMNHQSQPVYLVRFEYPDQPPYTALFRNLAEAQDDKNRLEAQHGDPAEIINFDLDLPECQADTAYFLRSLANMKTSAEHTPADPDDATMTLDSTIGHARRLMVEQARQLSAQAETQPTTPHCPRCGSADIIFDSASQWDAQTGDFMTTTTYDSGATCEECELAEFDPTWSHEDRLTAFADRSGQISFTGDASVPDGMLAIACAPSDQLRRVVSVNARFAYNNKTLLVPGVPEAKDDADALDALLIFQARVRQRLNAAKNRDAVTGRAVDSSTVQAAANA